MVSYSYEMTKCRALNEETLRNFIFIAKGKFDEEGKGMYKWFFSTFREEYSQELASNIMEMIHELIVSGKPLDSGALARQTLELKNEYETRLLQEFYDYLYFKGSQPSENSPA